MDNELCPFCDGDVLLRAWHDEDGANGPGCKDCGATAPSIEAWNHRPQLAKLQARLLTMQQEERERCARIAEEQFKDSYKWSRPGEQIAAAIRRSK